MEFHGRWVLSFLFLFTISQTALADIEGQFVAGEYIVKLKNSRTSFSTGSGTLADRFKGYAARVVSNRGKTMMIKRAIVERPEAVIAELSRDPMVELVEPNYIYEANLLPNDSRMRDLWGLSNSKKSSGGVDIDAEGAWDIITGNRDVVVAVIDTGVNYNHPDLRNNMWRNEAEANGVAGVDDDGNGYVDDIYGYDFANKDGNPMDDQGHGTHCAGTIGAEGDNGIGVVGVSWKVQLMALKFLSRSGKGTLEDALLSIDYATDKGVDIMSNSWGGGAFSQNLKEAIERAEQAGILFVAAAGNDRSNNDSKPSYPSSYDVSNVLSVAAIDSRGRLASFSNYGKDSVHVAAPGVSILSTSGSSSYRRLSGTSMATPHVSGIAALLLANEPNLSYSELKERIQQTSVPRSNLNSKITYGVVNALNALNDKRDSNEVSGPEAWPSITESVSTQHPYSDRTDQSYTLSVPGAQQVAVHFSRFDLENNYDKVIFFDGDGNNIGEMTGSQDDSYSPVAAGDTIVVQFVSDYSVTRYGFDIDRIHYQADLSNQWRSRVDPVSTDHPYPNYLDQEVVFEQPGAQEIRVKFAKFETEQNYDFVIFYDGDGNELARWDGDHSGELSPTAQGDKIIVRIKTDYSITDYGFDIEEVQYK